jgi:HEPN domain-containing protein
MQTPYKITLRASTSERTKSWKNEFQLHWGEPVECPVEWIEWNSSSTQKLGNCLILDSQIEGWEAWLREQHSEDFGQDSQESFPWVILVVCDPKMISRVVNHTLGEGGLVDDFLVFPFQSLDLSIKRIQFEKGMRWKSVFGKDLGEVNASLSSLVERLQDDLQLAERLQKAKLPTRFPKVKGCQISSRYLAGIF